MTEASFVNAHDQICILFAGTMDVTLSINETNMQIKEVVLDKCVRLAIREALVGSVSTL